MPGRSASLIAHRHDIAANQLFTWRRLMAQDALIVAGAGEAVVLASHCCALRSQVCKLQRLLGKKTMKNEVLREAVTRAAGSKNCCSAQACGQGSDSARRSRSGGLAACSPFRDLTCRPTPTTEATP